MNKQAYSLSPLPRPTWGWLKINDIELHDGEKKPYASKPYDTLPKGVSETKDRMLPVQDSIVLKDTAKYVADNANYRLSLQVSEQAQSPIVLDYDLENQKLVEQLQVTMEKDSKATIILRYTGDDAVHWGQLSLDVGENAELTLLYLQMQGGKHAGALSATVQKNGNLHIFLGELGGSEAISGCDIRLIGQGAKANVDSIYVGGKNNVRDMNYRILFEGRETEGDINVVGALTGDAKKTMKSTIDFLTGAVEAKGRETESVLVLDERVRNISSPLLLCREDNVDGQHATNIGRPDEDKLYYLMSRGFAEKEAKKLLIEAAFTPLLSTVSDEKTREEILNKIHEVTDYE